MPGPAKLFTLHAEQGAKLERQIFYSPDGVALVGTGYSGRLTVRTRTAGAPTTLIVDSTTGPNDLLVWDAALGTAGGFSLTVSIATLATIPHGLYEYDIKLIPPSGEADAFTIIKSGERNRRRYWFQLDEG